ncbi:eukaryotic translation initiation factor 3 subunit K [Verruconis gallopava]|uniref:Eukaryotic translation initiation factor 3 subunit K n=1 Tax=Verruconis gallopava TaxID=253628 RepID=A0A0D2A8K5_9PEZI|nr:eukaryotic translation initiation factor 3 subunit K [Verruconis gallopava]KIW02905.1 eukaryotic translation initiation factor 3 subunit K [Verruconis gallopava]
MGVVFDSAVDRPEHIENILNGLDRYNPETTEIFSKYVMDQCENQTYDCYANLALLKLYQFNPHLTREETITNILVKALTVFPSPDFSLCLSLLPPHTLSPTAKTSHSTPAAGDAPLSEMVQKLNVLNNYLSSADYSNFWSTLDSDDLYADLVADVVGFEELMRIQIAVEVGKCVREIQRNVLEDWLNLKGSEFDNFMSKVCGWEVNGATVKVPLNKENEAKGTVVRENVKFDQFSRLIRRAYEQPA